MNMPPMTAPTPPRQLSPIITTDSRGRPTDELVLAAAPTLADMAREGLKLRAHCAQCSNPRGPSGEWLPGRAPVIVDPAELGAKIGMDTPIGQVGRHLKCEVCGASGKGRGSIFVMPESKPIGPMGLARVETFRTVW